MRNGRLRMVGLCLEIEMENLSFKTQGQGMEIMVIQRLKSELGGSNNIKQLMGGRS